MASAKNSPIAKPEIVITQSDNYISLKGALTVDNIRDAFQQTMRFKPGHQQLDMSSVTQIDSAGVALLVYWRQQAQQQNCELTVSNVPPQADSLIHISGLGALLGEPDGASMSPQ